MGPKRHRKARAAALLLMLVCLLSCRPELVVSLSTRVYPDGSLDRQLRVIGRDDEGNAPEASDWLEAEAGLRLVDPDGWARVEEGPGWLRAEGFYSSVDDLPPLLGHRTTDGTRADRIRTDLRIDDGVVLTRWSYAQHHGDLHSTNEVGQAVAALTELAAEALEAEIGKQFGRRVDATPALEMLRRDIAPLVTALVLDGRRNQDPEDAGARVERWSRILSQHGFPAAGPVDLDDYWESRMPALLDALRDRVATALTDERQTVRPEELTFWPSGDDPTERFAAVAERVWGSTEALEAEVEPLLTVLSGYYGGDDGPRFRFEIRVELPGTLLRTNGTPDGSAAIWLLRDRDLGFDEQILRIESIRLDDEALRRLGARRTFEPAELVRLTDLIWKRDREAALLDLLTQAKASGNLDRLRDPDRVPDELILEARELAELLTPR